MKKIIALAVLFVSAQASAFWGWSGDNNNANSFNRSNSDLGWFDNFFGDGNAFGDAEIDFDFGMKFKGRGNGDFRGNGNNNYNAYGNRRQSYYNNRAPYYGNRGSYYNYPQYNGYGPYGYPAQQPGYPVQQQAPMPVR